MEWKKEYNIGIESIDTQHRQLADTISRLEASITTDTQNKEMGRALKFLVDYTNSHFSDEELYMQKVGYPAFDRHKTLHKDLTQKLMDVLLKLKNEGTIQPRELIDFLIDWLLNHILDEDKKIALHVSGQADTTTAKEIALQEIAETDIVKKLQKLKALHEKQLINQADYEDKKKSFLIQYSSTEAPLDPGALDHKFSYLGALQKDQLISKEDEKEHKQILFKQVDLESLLKRIPELEKKFAYLKSVFEDSYITAEAYENLKSKLLQEI
jgi:hemerythrin-like metal-binding protein